jgi:hypothetical protein
MTKNTITNRTLSRIAVTAVTVVLFLSMSVNGRAGDEPQAVTLKDTVNVSFGKAWNAVKEAMVEFGCGEPQTEKVVEPADEVGFYTGIYVSDFCMVVTGEDSTRDVMEKYGELPRIRGGIWITGRIQYKINVKEFGIRQTMIILRAELSGFEEFITNRVYFWTSNGILEKRMRDTILAKIAASSGE